MVTFTKEQLDEYFFETFIHPRGVTEMMRAEDKYQNIREYIQDNMDDFIMGIGDYGIRLALLFNPVIDMKEEEILDKFLFFLKMMRLKSLKECYTKLFKIDETSLGRTTSTVVHFIQYDCVPSEYLKDSAMKLLEKEIKIRENRKIKREFKYQIKKIEEINPKLDGNSAIIMGCMKDYYKSKIKN